MRRWWVLLGALLVVAVAVWLLFTVAFPWVDRQLNDPALGLLLAGAPLVARLRTVSGAGWLGALACADASGDHGASAHCADRGRTRR